MSRVLILAVVALAAPAVAKTTGSPLVDAFERGDRVGIERAALTSSARTLAEMLESDSRRAVLAAVIAAPKVDEAPRLLGPLAIAAHSADRSVALASARAALTIATATTSSRFADLEVTRTALGDALRTWHSLARDTERWADVRALALAVTAALAAELAGKPAAAVIELAGDPDPELRLAAFELLPSPLPALHAPRVASAIATDKVPRVALAAAVALCGGVAFGDTVDVASALKEASRRVLAQLVLDKTLPPALRLDAAHCLPAIGQSALIADVVKTLPKPLAAKARELLEAP